MLNRSAFRLRSAARWLRAGRRPDRDAHADAVAARTRRGQGSNFIAPRQFVKRDGRGGGDVQAFDRALDRKSGDLVAGFAGQAAQAFAFGAQHQRHAAVGEDRAGQRLAAGIQADAPDIGGLQRDHRAGDVDRTQQRHGFQRARRGLGQSAGFLRRVAVLGDDGGGAERGGRAHDRADIARVGHLIQHDDRPGFSSTDCRLGWRQRIGQQRRALMHDVAAQQLIEPAAIDPLGRHRPGRRQLLAERRLGFLGQQQAAQTARRIGQRGGDGMVAIQPDGAFRRLRAVARAIVMRTLRPGPMAVARRRSALRPRPLLAVAAVLSAAQRQTVATAAATTLGTLWPVAATLSTLWPVAATLSTLGRSRPPLATLAAKIATRAAAATVPERRTIGRPTTLTIVMRRFHHLVL